MSECPVSPVVDEIHYPKTSAEYIPSLQMCGQHVTGWAGDTENWGSPKGALKARGLIPTEREGGKEGNEWLWRDHS